MPASTTYETKGAPSGDTITGLINSSNTVFVLTNIPTTGSCRAFVNGTAVIISSISDYTVTLATAPATGSLLLIVYNTYTSSIGASVVSICNIALVLLGAKKITAIDDGSTNAVILEVLYDVALNQLMAERDWRFAKDRVALTQNASTPTFNWQYAYNLPSNFLRLVAPKGDLSLGQNPVVSQVNSAYYFYAALYSVGKVKYDYPIYPPGFPYVIEALSDDTFVLLTDYDNSEYDIYINYIRNDVDPSVYPGVFIMALAYKLAEMAAIPIANSEQIHQAMISGYANALYSAAVWNESLDMVDTETGDNSWERAGR